MKRSTEFGATMKHGVRCMQSDLVIHVLRSTDPDAASGPRVGLVVGKSVGSAVDRHRVARRLRHVARAVLGELDATDRVVIRALPSSRHVISGRLENEVRTGLVRARVMAERER